jgi:hypothetical protein
VLWRRVHVLLLARTLEVRKQRAALTRCLKVAKLSLLLQDALQAKSPLLGVCLRSEHQVCVRAVMNESARQARTPDRAGHPRRGNLLTTTHQQVQLAARLPVRN